MIAGVTRVRYRPSEIQGAEEDVRGVAGFHEQVIRGSEGFRGALFMLDRDTGEAIGIALWDGENDLRRTEGILGRDEGRGGRSTLDHLTDPTSEALTDYGRARAAAIALRRGTMMEVTDLFEVAIEISK